MLLLKAIVLLGIAVLPAIALDNDLFTSSTLSTKYIEHHISGEQSTYSTSWRTRKPSVSISTNVQQTTTVNEISPQITSVRPNNAIVAHRMAVIASEKWGRFPTEPDDETEVSWIPETVSSCIVGYVLQFRCRICMLSRVYTDKFLTSGLYQRHHYR